MDLATSLEGYLKLAGMVVSITLGITALWVKLKMTEKIICLWNKTLGYPVVLIKDIHRQLHSDDGIPLRDEINSIKQEVNAARVEQHVDFMARKEALFQADPEGNCIGANTAYLRLVHRTFEEVSGQGWVAIFPREEREEIMQEWQSAIEHGRNFDMVLHIKNLAGELVKVHAQAFRKVSSDGSTAGYMGRLDPI